MVHASDEAELLPEDQLQMMAEVVKIVSENAEQRAIVDWLRRFAPTSPSMLEEFRVGETPAESSWRGRSTASCGYPPLPPFLHATMCPQVSEAASALQRQETRESCQETRVGKNGQKLCERQETAREPCGSQLYAIGYASDTLHTLDGGSETGSNEKFSMRLAWQRDFCSVVDRLRSSSSASGLIGPSRAPFPDPVRSHSGSTAFSGSISWLTSLKRTDCDCSWAGDAMVG
jgi:hypothetical protein